METNCLYNAWNEENDAEVARLFPTQQFTLIEQADESDEEGQVPLTAEVDDFPVLLAFSTDEHAELFAGAMPDLFDVDEEIAAFVVDGRGLLENLPEGFGLVVNAECEDCMVMEPDEVTRIKSAG